MKPIKKINVRYKTKIPGLFVQNATFNLKSFFISFLLNIIYYILLKLMINMKFIKCCTKNVPGFFTDHHLLMPSLLKLLLVILVIKI